MTLHPVTRLVIGVACVVIVLGHGTWWVSVAVLALVEVPLASLQGVLLPFLRAAARVAGPIALSAGLMSWIFSPDGSHFIGHTSAPGTGGSVEALTLALQIVAGLSGMVLLFATTRPSDLAVGLEEKGLPTSVAYLVAASFQLVPAMSARVGRVRQSLQARGADFQSSWPRRLALLPAMAVPVIVCELLAAEQRAGTLMARGFGMEGRKTTWKLLPEKSWEALLRWVLALGCVADVAHQCLRAWA